MSAIPEQQPRRRGRPPAGGREAILAAALKLLRERGIARLTTREVANLAGVSEGSVFYHYGDRTGLLKAVFEEGVRPLQGLAEDPGLNALPPREFLSILGRELERFLDQVLPVMAAAQSEIELRDALGGYMTANDLGPHRGVQALSAYLRERQEAGEVRSDLDSDATALMFIGSCFIRASQRQMIPGENTGLPGLDDVIEAFMATIAPSP